MPSTTLGLKLANQLFAFANAAGKLHRGAQAGQQRYVLEWTDIDEAQAGTCLGDETNLNSPRGADKEDFGFMALNQLVGHGEGWNDVAAGAASGNKNSQFRQLLAFLQRCRLIN